MGIAAAAPASYPLDRVGLVLRCRASRAVGGCAGCDRVRVLAGGVRVDGAVRSAGPMTWEDAGWLAWTLVSIAIAAGVCLWMTAATVWRKR
jgi:hypothetical protein